MRLHHRIDELEKQNRRLTGMLSDAIGICDAAIADDEVWRKALDELVQQSPPTDPR